MTTWTASVGDILDASADVLICSANPQLNLSGGVGGAFLVRFGRAMQDFLHVWLKELHLRFAMPGTVVMTPAMGSPFTTVVHAVAIDAFYDTSPALIRATYSNAFAALGESDGARVAAACLGCGYGRVTVRQFVDAISDFLGKDLPGIEEVHFVSTNTELIDAIRAKIKPS